MINKIIARFKKKKPRKGFQVVDPVTNEWYWVDENYNLWVESKDYSVSLKLSTCSILHSEGELRELTHALSGLRKALNLRPSDPIPDSYEIINEHPALER